MRVYRVDGGHVVTKDAPENDSSIFGVEIKGGNIVSVLFNNQTALDSIAQALDPWNYDIEKSAGASDAKYTNFIRAQLKLPGVTEEMFFANGLASQQIKDIPDNIDDEIGRIARKGKTERPVPEGVSTFEKIDEDVSGPPRRKQVAPPPRPSKPAEPNEETKEFLKYFHEFYEANDTLPERLLHKVVRDETDPWVRMSEEAVDKVDMGYVFDNLQDEEEELFCNKTQVQFFTIEQFNDLVERLHNSWWTGISVYYPEYKYDDGKYIDINPFPEEGDITIPGMNYKIGDIPMHTPDTVIHDDGVHKIEYSNVTDKDFDDIEGILEAFATYEMRRNFAQRIDINQTLEGKLDERLKAICERFDLSIEDDFNRTIEYEKVEAEEFKQMVREALKSDEPLNIQYMDVSKLSISRAFAGLEEEGLNPGKLRLETRKLSHSKMNADDYQFLNDALEILGDKKIRRSDVDILRPKRVKEKETGALKALGDESEHLLDLFERAHSRGRGGHAESRQAHPRFGQPTSSS